MNLYMTLPNKFVSETTCYIPDIYLLYIIITPQPFKRVSNGYREPVQHLLVSRCTLPDSAAKGNVRMTLEMPRPKGCILILLALGVGRLRGVFFCLRFFSFNVEVGQ